MPVNRATSWRQILRQHSQGFRSWLDTTGARLNAFNQISNALQGFLKNTLSNRETCRLFWERIPDVRAGCNDNSVYEKPLAAEAYAYVHLLERYRRFWDVLLHLTERKILPLADYGVNSLDIGTGPAPALYAIDDFYRLITQYATVHSIDELKLPEPRLDCIESSQNMMRFCHHFSEFAGRRGPFGATLPDFSGLDFRSIRAEEFERLKHQTYHDYETGEDEYEYPVPDASDYANSLFRYRLIIFSNFLTLSGTVDAFRSEIENLLRDLNPGSVEVIVGAYGEQYQSIYAKLAEIAAGSRLLRIRWLEEELGEETWPMYASPIKAFQYSIYQHITGYCDPDSLPREGYPDYWNPQPSRKARPKFGLRVFRRGRLIGVRELTNNSDAAT